MPRHTFRFPAHIRNAVHQYVEKAIAGLEATRFRQEPNYTAALAHALQGTAYSSSDGSVMFTATPMDDRARKSAEHEFGADLAITADISGDSDRIRKAIMIQAKLGAIQELNDKNRDFLNGQIKKMQAVTKSPKVMELILDGDKWSPRIISGNRVLKGESYRPMDLAKYITARVLTTLDGDTRPNFVNAVQDSSLAQLRMKARTGKQ